MLTGAGGSIGSALAKAILSQSPRSLLLLDHSEGNLHQIDFELSVLSGGHARCPILGDVCDGALLEEIFEEHVPQVVIHAAAFKHVPLVERNPIPALRNNALGTILLAKTARSHPVASLVMVSTDKAVNPHSLMGASKRLAELALLRWTSPQTPMRAVRLGNVLGSCGSVVPMFLQQISSGGPVTVTHPRVDRYFLSLDEAVELLLRATSLDGAGGIFIPDPGEPVRILDLARQLIKEAGFEPEREIPIVMTGLRPGDKMSEEFVSASESVQSAAESGLRSINTPQPSPEEFDSCMAALKESLDRRDLPLVLDLVCRLVPEYCPSDALLAPPNEPLSGSQ